MPYVAMVNVPGYLPESDTPTFETAREAWHYLMEERVRDEDYGADDGAEDYSETAHALQALANSDSAREDVVYGSTPGSDSPHDLGLVYSVQYVTEDEAREYDSED